jgi:hypothetical protein
MQTFFVDMKDGVPKQPQRGGVSAGAALVERRGNGGPAQRSLLAVQHLS